MMNTEFEAKLQKTLKKIAILLEDLEESGNREYVNLVGCRVTIGNEDRNLRNVISPLLPPIDREFYWSGGGFFIEVDDPPWY